MNTTLLLIFAAIIANVWFANAKPFPQPLPPSSQLSMSNTLYQRACMHLRNAYQYCRCCYYITIDAALSEEAVIEILNRLSQDMVGTGNEVRKQSNDIDWPDKVDPPSFEKPGTYILLV